ncbi:NACHT domain-containing protein [Actinoplanes sp. NPDC051343]|uniref:NACHT domain-containing protein n=1 Tax=Actinoplanes sp. NPDC051343 TaxID=3363906 RepID=UPI00379688B5
MNRAPTNLTRYWADRSKDIRDVESVRPEDYGPARLAEAVAGRCTVLLAPPGAGKTTDLTNLVRELGEKARFVSLGTHGDLARKITHTADELGASGGEGLLLALDSVDESQLPTTQLVSLIEEVAEGLPDGVRLVLACRTAAWLPGLDQVLRSAFPGEVAVLDLLPLTDRDVITFAEASGVNGSSFLDAVRAAHATPLVRYPNELRFLLDLYRAQDGAALPHTQLDLYDSAVGRLCSEPNVFRQDATGAGQSAVRSGAGRLAVLSLFTARSNFLLRGIADGRSLGEEDYANLLPEETPVRAAYADVLGCALFEGVEDGTLKFVHQTVAEYLAARHLSDLDLTQAQLDAMLRVPGGRLAPQMQAVASWLIALNPGRFATLLDDDPVAFIRSHVELPDAGFRQALTRRLLVLADEYSLDEPHHLDLSGLGYAGIEDDLHPYLTGRDHSIDARYLALRVVSDNRLAKLNDVLVDIALDDSEMITLRNAAGRRSLELVPTAHDNPLQALAELADPSLDEDDELLGVGLRARLRAGTSPSAILRNLKRPKNPDLFGSYWSFVAMELPEAFSASSLTDDEVRESVQWVAGLEPGERSAMPRLGGRPVCSDGLQDAILRAGFARIDDPVMRGDVARLVRLCLTEADQKLFREREASPLDLSDRARRSLLVEVIANDDDVVLAWGMADSGLLRAGDLEWVVELADARHTSQPHTMRAWVLSCFDRNRPDHQEIVQRRQESSPVRRWLSSASENPVPARRGQPEAGPTTADLHLRLAQALAADPVEAFAQFCWWAAVKPGQANFFDDLEIDAREMPGWASLEPEERRRAVHVAGRYLREGLINDRDNLGTDRFNTAALAGLRAMALVSAEYGTVDLPAERWAFWAPALVHTPFNSRGHGNPLVEPLRLAYEAASEALLDAAKQDMSGDHKSAQSPLERLSPVLGTDAVAWLSSLIDDPAYDDTLAVVAYSRLLTLDRAAAFRKIAEDADPTPRSRAFAVTALQVIGSPAWSVLSGRLQRGDFAKGVLGDLTGSHVFDPVRFTETDLAGIWELILELFPPQEDPVVHGVHSVGSRETIGHERDRMLPALADRGTAEAVRVLTDLAERHPKMPYLRRLVARARSAMARADWVPLSPNEVRLALSRSRRLLRNEAHLLEMVIEALGYTQDRVLQGVSPLATLLWDHHRCGRNDSGCRPKSEDEVSDFLDHQIRAYLPGVMVNREVQVKRLRPSGIGERSDLLVQVPATGSGERILRVVIEAKGCWNDEVADALEKQLVERYLEPMPDAAGLFLVAWFDPRHGAREGTWRNDEIRGDHDRLWTNLAERAGAATEKSGRPVRAVIVDCSMPVRA